jgi:hypothetical protein
MTPATHVSEIDELEDSGISSDTTRLLQPGANEPVVSRSLGGEFYSSVHTTGSRDTVSQGLHRHWSMVYTMWATVILAAGTIILMLWLRITPCPSLLVLDNPSTSHFLTSVGPGYRSIQAHLESTDHGVPVTVSFDVTRMEKTSSRTIGLWSNQHDLLVGTETGGWAFWSETGLEMWRTRGHNRTGVFLVPIMDRQSAIMPFTPPHVPEGGDGRIMRNITLVRLTVSAESTVPVP